MVVSGPSGTGKGTVVSELMRTGGANLFLSVSATTRKPRPHETPGVHYHFVSRGLFLSMIEGGALLEHAEYAGNYYGTPEAEVEAQLQGGKDVILEIDVQGGIQVRKKKPEVALVFLVPPSIAELERRLRERQTEEEDVIQRRLQLSLSELQIAKGYDYVVRNDFVGDAVSDILSILRAERCRVANRLSVLNEQIGALGGTVL
ncbi:guanylate kinase [Oscillospiraceae bacterium OttesenSCG-928-G22]|nr:guanylate kinase [Oscillospiraceae bacterium OttesenSCG-928-G22]